MTARLVLVSVSPRVPAGLLSWPAWRELHEGPALVGTADHPLLPALADAGVAVSVETPDARRLLDRVRATGRVVWLDPPARLARSLAELVVDAPDVALEVVPGSWDPPGARLLDVVATMDRLRSPGGCPWDAEQSHDSLKGYLLEEAYEAYEALEDGDLDALREELGDVLLQVVFHARLAEEDAGWSVDDVAGDLVGKLVRRHPHVFGDRVVSGSAEVNANWDAIKVAEKGRMSVTDGVPLGQPALALAAKLQRRATAAGLPDELVTGVPGSARTGLAAALAGAADRLVDGAAGPPLDAAGELLFLAVALVRTAGVEPEPALRGAARRFRDRLAAAEGAAYAEGRSIARLGTGGWRELWARAAPARPAS